MAQRRSQKKTQILKTVRAFIRSIERDGIPVSRAYLYGSWSSGYPHRGSDIDVCIISPRFRDPWRSTQYLWKKAFSINPSIEPIAYHPSHFQETSPLVWEIKTKGLRIV